MATTRNVIKTFVFIITLLALSTMAAAEELAIIYTANTNGYVEPCG